MSVSGENNNSEIDWDILKSKYDHKIELGQNGNLPFTETNGGHLPSAEKVGGSPPFTIHKKGEKLGLDVTRFVPTEPDAKDTDQGRRVVSVLVAVVIAIGSLATGTVFGYPSPAMPNLNSNPNPFHLDSDQTSWAGSIITLGGLAGGLVGGPYTDLLGRKLSLMGVLVPFAIGWVIITASPSYGCLLAGRFLTGFCTGVTLVICPVYISEVAPAPIRGLLGSFHQCAITLGNLFSYTFGSFLDWNWLSVACTALLPILMSLLCFIPETPRWLLSKKRPEEARHALQWLRGKNTDISAELLANEEMIRKAADKATLREFLQPQLLKPLLITMGLMVLQQTSGINVVMFYTVEIFTLAESTMDPYVQTIMVGSFGFLGTLVSIFVADLLGRRPLLLISAVIMTVSMGGLGAFFYELELDEDYATGTLSWLPILCLVFFNFGFNVAYGPIPWVMMGELFPVRAKGLASSMATAVNRLMAFVMTKFFVNMTDAMHVYGGYWLCCGFCAIAIPFVIFFVPETKGKTLEQIERSFKGEKTDKS